MADREKSALGRPADRYSHEDLRTFAAATLTSLAVPADGARGVAACLVKAELRGVDSHGMVRLPVYGQRVRAGVVRANPEIRVISSSTATALVDGDNGLGPMVAESAMAVALDLAQQHGTALVGVRHSNHFGPAAYYVEQAVERGFIGVSLSNAPPNMAPFGGRSRFLGTNPLAVGVPAGEEPPLIFDASTSVAARGKIIMAAHNDEAIPSGWAIDPDGYPTTDAHAALAGAVLPFGGPKGSAISFLIDVACGVLTGAAFAEHLRTLEDLSSVQNVGHVMVAIRPDIFLPDDEFRQRMDAILRMLKASPPSPAHGTGVLAPGDIERAHETHARRHGIPLAHAVVTQITRFGDSCGVPFPAPVSSSSGTEPCSA